MDAHKEGGGRATVNPPTVAVEEEEAILEGGRKEAFVVPSNQHDF